MLADRSFVDQMKLNILRRAEDIWDEDEDDVAGDEDVVVDERGKKVRIVAFLDDDIDDAPVSTAPGRGLSVVGDGEESDNGEDDGTDVDVSFCFSILLRILMY